MFSCKFCEISKKTFFTERFWWLLLRLEILLMVLIKISDEKQKHMERLKEITFVTILEDFQEGA